MSDYNPHNFEQKWQQKWEESNLYRSEVDWDKPKHYAVTMLPYPSGDLHIGHWFAMTPSDARARFMRMKGFNVLFPMGYDAFGLPAEQYAIQTGQHPAVTTKTNIEGGTDKDGNVIGIIVDAYDVFEAFDPENRTEGETHALKKLLVPGQRGAKGVIQDIKEAIRSLETSLVKRIHRDIKNAIGKQ